VLIFDEKRRNFESKRKENLWNLKEKRQIFKKTKAMRLVIDLRDRFPWLQRPNEPRNVGFCLCAYHCVLLIVEFLIDLGKIGIVCNSFNKVDGYFPQFDVLLTVILLNVVFNVIKQVLEYFIGDLFYPYPNFYPPN